MCVCVCVRVRVPVLLVFLLSIVAVFYCTKLYSFIILPTKPPRHQLNPDKNKTPTFISTNPPSLQLQLLTRSGIGHLQRHCFVPRLTSFTPLHVTRTAAPTADSDPPFQTPKPEPTHGPRLSSTQRDQRRELAYLISHSLLRLQTRLPFVCCGVCKRRIDRCVT